MKCYNHSTAEAVGQCKSCGKFFFFFCITEIKNGLACKNSCEKRVALINKIIDSNEKAMVAVRSQLKNSGISGIVIGIIFIVFAFLAYNEFEGSFLPYFFGVFGIVSLLSGAFRLT